MLKLLATDLEHYLCSHSHGPFLSQQGTAGTYAAEQSDLYPFVKAEPLKRAVSHVVQWEARPLLRKVSNT